MMRLKTCWFIALAVTAVALSATWTGTANAQTPLVGAGDPSLIFYFPFEEEDLTLYDEPQDPAAVLGVLYGNLADRSGHAYDGTVVVPDPVFGTGTASFGIDTGNKYRGNGAVHFVQSTDPAVDGAVYVDLHGEDLFDNHPGDTVAATDSATYASWVYIDSATGLHTGAIFQGRGSGPNGGSGHGGPHFQTEGDGRLRMVNRDSDGSGVVDAPGGGRFYPDTGSDSVGNPYPLDEWFHIAMTIDHDSSSYTFWYNGEAKVTGFSVGSGELGDWGGMSVASGRGGDPFALGFGAVYDNLQSRNLTGWMDELYVFNRALSANEIGILAGTVAPGLDGDGNGDGWVDGLDYLLWAGNFGTHPGPDGDVSDGDYNDDGWVDGLDYLLWAGNFGSHQAGAAVPEPGTLTLLALSATMLFGIRRRK